MEPVRKKAEVLPNGCGLRGYTYVVYSVMNAMPRNVSYVNPQAETVLREKVAQQVLMAGTSSHSSDYCQHVDGGATAWETPSQ